MVSRRQQGILEFQNAQIRFLMDKMGRKRILPSDQQRRILAARGKAIGRSALMELTTTVTPETTLRWHRRLIAAKWDYTEKLGEMKMSADEKSLIAAIVRAETSVKASTPLKQGYRSQDIANRGSRAKPSQV